MFRLPPFFRSKRAHQQELVQDVFSEPKKRFLDLRRHAHIIEFHWDVFRSFLKEHSHSLWVIVGGMMVVSSFFVFKPIGASQAVFHPTTCLGGWQHPQNAVGKPDLKEGSASSLYTDANSAVLKNSVAEVYCGGFLGEIPEAATPTAFRLSFYWSVDDGKQQHTVEDPYREGSASPVIDSTQTSTETSAEETAPQSPSDTDSEKTQQDSLEAVNLVPDLIPVSNSNSDLISTPTPDVAPTPTPTPTPTPEAGTNSESSAPSPEATLFRWIADLFTSRVVLAQEETAPSETSVSLEDASPSSDAVDSVPTPASAPEEQETSTENEAPSRIGIEAGPVPGIAQTNPSDGDLLEVSYTLDGSIWKKLGTVNASNWTNARFDIVDSDMTHWSDLSRLQVSVRSISSFSNAGAVYLDAMELSVDYEQIPALLNPPVIELSDSSALISSEKNEYAAEDVPTFDITAPELSVEDINDLVKENKAVVLEDVRGVLGAQIEDGKPVDIKEPIGEKVQSLIETLLPSKDAPLIEQPLVPASNVEVIEGAPETPVSSLWSPSVAYAETTVSALDVAIYDMEGSRTTIPTVVERVVVDGQTKNRITFTKPGRMFRPGKYTLKVTLHTPQAILVSKQDFSWGVLALNVDKSIYAPGDEAYVQMGVLDDHGRTICDADLDLRIESPTGGVIIRSTSDGSLIRDPKCGPDNVIDVPDYHTRVVLPETPGTYTMHLRAETDNGARTMNDSFEIRASSPVVIQRVGPTRIFPVANYPMKIAVKSESNWTGTIVEHIPSSFTPSPLSGVVLYDDVMVSGEVTTISWNVSLIAGEEKILGYTFDAPNISPEFYILGPAALYAGSPSGPVFFAEARQWQIANDAVCSTTTGLTSGNWDGTSPVGAGSVWTGCSGAGGIPGSGDVVTINSGATVTLNVNAPASGALGDLTIAGTLTNTTFTLTTGTATFTVNSGGTFNAGSGAITSGSVVADGAYNANSATLTIAPTGAATMISIGASGAFDAGSATININPGTSSGSTILSRTSGGTFTGGTSTVALGTTGGAGNVTLNSGSFTGVNKLNNFSTNHNASATLILGEAFEVGGTFTKTSGVFKTDATCTGVLGYALTAGNISLVAAGSVADNFCASTISLTGTSGTLFARGTFTPAPTVTNASFDIKANGAVTIFSGTAMSFKDLSFSPVLNGDYAYTMGVAPTLSGTISANPTTANAPTTYIVTLPTMPTLAATKTFTVTGDGYATTALSANWSIGFLSIGSGGIFAPGSTNLTLTGTSGTLLSNSSGSFVGGTSTVTIPTGTTSINSTGFTGSNALYNLTFSNVGTKTLGAALDVANNTTISAGSLDTNSSGNYTLTTGRLIIANSASASINLRGSSTLVLNASSGTLLTKGAGGVFTAGASSTVQVVSDGDITFLSGATTIKNLTFSPTLTGSHTYTIGSVPTLSGTATFTINPSGSGTLTVSPSATTVMGSSVDLIVQGTGSAIGKLDTTGSNYAMTFGTMSIGNNGQVVLNGSTITLGGASTLLSLSGTGSFNRGTSTIIISSVSNVNLNTTGFIGSNKLYNLSTNNINTRTLGAAIEIEGTLSITNGVFDTDSTNSYALTAGFITLANTAGTIFRVRNSVVTLTGTSGTLFTKGAASTFTVGASTFSLESASGAPSFISTALTFHKLRIDSDATVINEGAAITINNVSGAQLYIKKGVFNTNLGITGPGSGNGTLQIDATGTLCLGGTVSASNTSATCNTGATSTTARAMPTFQTYTFDPASTVIYLSDASTTISSSPTYGNLIILPTLTASRAYTLGNTLSVTGNFDSNPNGGGAARAVTTSLTTGGMSVTGSVTVQGNNSGTSVLDTTASNFALGAGSVNIATSSTLNIHSSTLTITGTSGTLFTRDGTFTIGGNSTTTFSGNGSATLNSGTITFDTLNSTGIGTKTLGAGITVSSAKTFTVSAGTFDPASNLVTGSGTNTLAVSSGATILVDASTFAGNYSSGFTTRTLDAASTVDYNLAGTQTIDSTLTYGNLTTSGASGTKSLNGTTTANGTLTLSDTATLDTTGSNYALNVANLTFSGGTLAANNSTVTVSGTGGTPVTYTSGSLTGTSTIAYTGNNAGGDTTVATGLTYYNLTLNNASETYQITGTLTTNSAGIVTAVAGTFDFNDQMASIGSLSIGASGTVLGGTGTVTLSGSWTNSGTFTKETSTMSFTGGTTATISGTTTFYDLSISHSAAKEVNFSVVGSPIFHVTNAFTVSGVSGGLIKLYSTSGGTKWNFHPTGTVSVSYANVKDGGCESGSIYIHPDDSTDGGNNDSCWAFTSITLSQAISDATIGFGTLSSSSAKYCTPDEAGSYSEVEAHTITAAVNSVGGYILTVLGSSLTNGTHTITPIGSSNIASVPGFEQFGIRAVATGGSGVVDSLYSGAGFGFPSSAATVPSTIATASTGDGVPTVYSMRYLTNISSTTPPGSYSTNLTYVLTGTF